MAGTDVTMRTAPPRRFENYVLTRLVDSSVGLTQVPAASFTQVPGPGAFTKNDAYNGAGAGGTDDATSNVLPIGFDFQIDGITYKQWCANCNGWMVLVDPTVGTFDPTEVMSTSVWINEDIKDTFTSNAVLLAPWFDDLRNALSSAGQLTSSPFNYSSVKVGRLTQGLEPTPIFVDSSSYGISYYLDVRSGQGRRLIVRWASVSNYTSPTSAIRFEVVIYENGTVEYRYTPRLTITAAASPFEGATVGIFMPNGTHRFRDFSIGLGYRETSRREYVYGGYAYDPTYVDAVPPGNEDFGSSAPYTVSLLPYFNWPGLASAGCVLTFSPPKNRRRVLPRRLSQVSDTKAAYPLVARTGDTARLGTGPSSFDDRLSPTYTVSGSTVVVNYPTTLTRFFGGNGVGVLQRQDLFSGDFLITGSVVKSAVDQYVIERPDGNTEAFSEVARPEQSGASDSFFLSGSDPSFVAAGFGQQLRSKTHVRFTLSVDTAVSMPAASSSIYYYNLRTKSWEVPANSTYVLGNASSTPPSPNPYAGGDWANPMAAAGAGRILEDARGFGPVGNAVSSGSHTPAGAGDQTDSAIGSMYTFGLQSAFLARSYDKSVRNNPQYSPVTNETFTLPINAPFLVEKAVFEVPLQAGPGWFKDSTQCFVPLANRQSFDFGGPGLTVALWRRVQLGLGPSAPTRLDLIMTGTVTHVYDMTASVVVSNFPPADSTYQIRPVGYLAYAGPPGAVVPDSGGLQFTGSVIVQAQALNTAGVDLIYRKSFASSSHGSNTSAALRLLTQTPTLSLSSSAGSATTTVQVGYVSPFGRGGAGFQPAGRSVLGNEFVTWQGMADDSAQTVANPLYLGPNGLSMQQSGALAGGLFAATASAVVHLGSHFPAPYLVMPGDNLVLSISKTRPAVYGTGQWFSGSSHDVVLPAGHVNVTLYGSQIAAGIEYHDSLNQPLNTCGVHELLGAEPVVDQFEVYYRNELSGTFTDNLLLGTMGVQTVLSYSGGTPAAWVNVQTSRDRKLSRLNARNAPALSTSATDVAITPSKSFRAEPWWEMAGNVRTSQFVDSSERYWDSMMPSVKDCFTADGSGIFITQYGTFGNSQQIDTGVSGTLAFTPQTTRMGWIWLDYGVPSLIAAGYGPLINSNWNKAYPFEPRYQGASRQLDIERSLVATYLYGGSPVVQQIQPTVVNGFAFGTTAIETAIFNFGGAIPIPGSVCWDWIVDVNLSGKNVFGYYVTGSTNRDDMARALFGFGDRNTSYAYTDTSKVLLGSNHVVETRDVEGPHPAGGVVYDNNYFRVSPRIRGWKYGVHSGLPAYTKAYWRRGRFGQFRDMLEQRPYGKFYQTGDTQQAFVRTGVQPGAVTVTFIDPSSGRLTSADNTWSSNLSQECTSSMPFFDGTSTNRPIVDPTILNLHPNVIRHDARGNIHIA